MLLFRFLLWITPEALPAPGPGKGVVKDV